MLKGNSLFFVCEIATVCLRKPLASLPAKGKKILGDLSSAALSKAGNSKG